MTISKRRTSNKETSFLRSCGTGIGIQGIPRLPNLLLKREAVILVKTSGFGFSPSRKVHGRDFMKARYSLSFDLRLLAFAELSKVAAIEAFSSRIS